MVTRYQYRSFCFPKRASPRETASASAPSSAGILLVMPYSATF
jgi:hypothetical protein